MLKKSVSNEWLCYALSADWKNSEGKGEIKYWEDVSPINGRPMNVTISITGSESLNPAGAKPLGLALTFVCTEDEDKNDLDVEWAKTYDGLEYISINTPKACSRYSLNALFIFLKGWLAVLINLALVPAGGFIMLYGRQKIEKTSLAALAVCNSFALMYILYLILLSNQQIYYINWLMFLMCSFVGAGTAWLGTKK